MVLRDARQLALCLAPAAAARVDALRQLVRRHGPAVHDAARTPATDQVIHDLAFQDLLTGLPNRWHFEEVLQSALLGAAPSARHALLLLDLSGFKNINDVYGHHTGDALIRVVAERLVQATRPWDLVARFGSDEFAVLLPDTHPDEALAIGQRIITDLDEPIVLHGEHRSIQCNIQTGIGAAFLPFDGATAEEVLRRADVALSRAKSERRSRLRCFDDVMDAALRQRERLATALRQAVRQREIGVAFQPLVDLVSEQIIGFEALARWRHPVLGEVPPAEFFDVAEDLGLGRALSDHLFHESCRVASTWPETLLLTFNMSPLQLRDPQAARHVLAVLARWNLPPSRLELEVTETAVMQDVEATQAIVGLLREMGVRVALDDFGTGYSSLSLLRALRPDSIKIDRSFVEQMTTEPESRTIIGAVVGLGHGLGLTVTAEGVETAAQHRALLAHRCDRGQGYRFGRPIAGELTGALLRSHTSLRRVRGLAAS